MYICVALDLPSHAHICDAVALLQAKWTAGSGPGGLSQDAMFDTLHHSLGGEGVSNHEETLGRLLRGKGTDDRGKDQRHTECPKGISMAMVPPFIRFLRRNEESLAKKVSQLSIMLREAKGERPISVLYSTVLHRTVIYFTVIYCTVIY